MIGMVGFHQAIPILASSCGQGMGLPARARTGNAHGMSDNRAGREFEKMRVLKSQSRNHFRPVIVSNPPKHNPSMAQAQAMAEDVWCLVRLAELGFIVV